MTTARQWLGVALVGVAIFARANAADPTPPLLNTQEVKRVGDEVHLPGLLIMGGDKPYVEATGKMAITNDILEFVAVENNGRDYESLVTLDCKPSAMKFGLLLIGCQDGATNGSLLSIDVEWQEHGQPRSLPVEALLIDRSTGKTPPTLPFFLSGSFFSKDLFTTNQIFHADDEQAHIALWWQPAVLINVRGDHGNPYRGSEQGFTVNSQVAPPSGTPVKLILRKRD